MSISDTFSYDPTTASQILGFHKAVLIVFLVLSLSVQGLRPFQMKVEEWRLSLCYNVLSCYSFE